MIQYHQLLRHVLANGQDRDDRTGVGTRSVFGYPMRFDLRDGFPLVTTKRTFFRGAAEELLWMLRGTTHVQPLQAAGVHIWDEWADADGSLGPIYGAQWRAWGYPDRRPRDQLQTLIDELRARPYSRRHVVSAWNVDDLPDETLSPAHNAAEGRMALAPCHTLFQCYVDQDPETGAQRLSLQVYQRSADVFLGVPFNLAGYALLVHLLAHHLHLTPGELLWSGGDVHLYHTHFAAAHELLWRTPTALPDVFLHHAPETPLDCVSIDDIELVGYAPHPPIGAPVAV